MTPTSSTLHSTARDGVRVSLDTGSASGPLDGAWWPRSRDLAVEIADLVDHYPHWPNDVMRVLFTRPDWDGQTPTQSDHKVRCDRGLVNVGSFPHDDTHRVVVVLRTGVRLTLMVIPPETAPDVAQSLLEHAADHTNTLSATALLAAALEPAPLPPSLHVWDSEGGHLA